RCSGIFCPVGGGASGGPGPRGRAPAGPPGPKKKKKTLVFFFYAPQTKKKTPALFLKHGPYKTQICVKKK
ncbi:hypothetical protein, partial [Enterobacter hormaechei]